MGERAVMTPYYAEMLEIGLKFQDYVMEKIFIELGIPISYYSSKENQIGKGENLQGIEIKFDDKFKDTGNLYIEIAEKSNANNKFFVQSGIYRDDNTWLYIIGDYDNLFIFYKHHLIEFHKKGLCKEVETLTSKGYLLSPKYHKWAHKI